MSWEGSTRGSRLPANWKAIRLVVLNRDQFRCRYCGAPANQVDHIVHGDDHRLENLQSLCADCHKRKSSSEGGRSRANRYKRPKRKHPGLID